MAETSIEWTDRTWSPVVGCTAVSPGCEHCYAELMASRQVLMSAALGRRSPYLRVVDAENRRWSRAKDVKADPANHQHVELLPERLDEPRSFPAGSKVFVCSMSDLFHEHVPFEFIAAVFGVMAACPKVTFQVLTKRAARMLEFFRWLDEQAGVAFFFKQWGGVRKGKAGRELDGRTHDAMPEVHHAG